MTLYLVGSALNIKVPLKIVQQDIEEVLDPLYNRDKIFDQPIMNAQIDKQGSLDINHRVRHVIKLTKDWIKRPFKLDPIPQVVVFHTTAHPTRGQGDKVTMPTFTTPSLVRLETMHQLDRKVGYYRAKQGKVKRKINYPQQVKLEEEPTQAPP